MRRRYFDLDGRQLHLRASGRPSDGTPALLCLPPLPYSGLYFETLASAMPERRLLCPDYPGYGGSDRAPGPPAIEAWARDLLALVDGLDESDSVDLLGFHTGCLVGAEMARQAPDRVRRLVLVDVPFFDAAGRARLTEKAGSAHCFDAGLDSLRQAWETNVASRQGRVPLARCLALLAEQLRAEPGAHEGFRAAFAYDPLPVFAGLPHRCLLISAGASLRGPTRAASEALASGRLLELPDTEPPVFETAVETIARQTGEFLQ
ncbi:MAG: alpha/beta hydrolase [Gammaproteobacteria bacterium]